MESQQKVVNQKVQWAGGEQRAKKSKSIKRLVFVLLAILIALLVIWLKGCTVLTSGNDPVPGEAVFVENTLPRVEPRDPNVGKSSVFAVKLPRPVGITIDYRGNMFVGSRSNNVIYKVVGHEVEEFVKVPGRELFGITVDSKNNIFAAVGDKVVKINPQGRVQTLAEGFSLAEDLKLDAKGNLYVTDAYENRVYKISPGQRKSIYIDNETGELKPQWYITGISFDPGFNNLYLTKMKDGEVWKYPIKPDGSPGKPVIVAKGIPEPNHLEIDNKGNVYVTSFGGHGLVKINLRGETEILNEEILTPTGIIFGKDGFDRQAVYIASYNNDAVFKVYVGAEGL